MQDQESPGVRIEGPAEQLADAVIVLLRFLAAAEDPEGRCPLIVMPDVGERRVPRIEERRIVGDGLFVLAEQSIGVRAMQEIADAGVGVDRLGVPALLGEDVSLEDGPVVAVLAPREELIRDPAARR